MPLANIGCGALRIAPWIGVDELKAHLHIGTPERRNLDADEAAGLYVEHRLGHRPLPFESDSFDGACLSHVLEHFSLQDSMMVLRDCMRILKPGAPLIISVPDAAYFRKVNAEDTPENAARLFGEPIHQNEQPTFLRYALLLHQHLQMFTEDSLWCLLRGIGFEADKISRVNNEWVRACQNGAPRIPNDGPLKPTEEAALILNRLPFSLIMEAVKS